jgi:hypothetical protein
MYFLLSGEGPTDIGLCSDNINVCEGNRHLAGPMAIMVSKIVEQQLDFSFMDNQYYGFVSKKELVNKASGLKSRKKSLLIPGKKNEKKLATSIGMPGHWHCAQKKKRRNLVFTSWLFFLGIRMERLLRIADFGKTYGIQ